MCRVVLSSNRPLPYLMSTGCRGELTTALKRSSLCAQKEGSELAVTRILQAEAAPTTGGKTHSLWQYIVATCSVLYLAVWFVCSSDKGRRALSRGSRLFSENR
jgi:hypothetical protein